MNTTEISAEPTPAETAGPKYSLRLRGKDYYVTPEVFERVRRTGSKTHTVNREPCRVGDATETPEGFSIELFPEA